MSPAVRAYVVDPLERAARTFVQQFTVVLLALPVGGLLLTQNWAFAADSAGFAAIVSVMTSVLTFKVPVLDAWLDLLLRVVKTALQSFVGTLIAGQVLSVSQADWRAALATAIPVAFTAFLTGLAALGVPTTYGASLLPAGTAQAADDGAEDDNSTAGMFPPYDPESASEPAPESAPQ